MRSCRLLLRRRFSEDPFKDEEGRFKNRWERNFTPSYHEHPMVQNVPNFPVHVDLESLPRDERIFDFSLPPGFQEFTGPLQIWAMSDGFFSVNQVWIPGPICVFPNFVFMWHVTRPEDIQEHHIEIAKIATPRPDYIIIGTGKFGKPVMTEGVIQRIKSSGVNIEYCPTFEACGTFNLTADDGRNVCAFLLPPDVV